jgi:hypothetical protein
MKQPLRGAILLSLALLPACAQQNVKDALGNLDKDCVRHYQGALGGGVMATATVSFQIDCQPSGLPPKVVTPVPQP